jgi:integrase
MDNMAKVLGKAREASGSETARVHHASWRSGGGVAARSAGGINEAVSPHWLRQAHGLHAIDRGASLPEVQSTLAHGNIATTSGYLHARPDTSSGLHLDPGVFLR